MAYLENKLKSTLVVIKRIIKYIPKSQYMNSSIHMTALYEELVKSGKK